MRGYFGIGVEGISKSMNVGSLFRTAHAFGASFVFTIAAQYERAEGERVDTSRAAQSVPLYEFDSVAALRLPSDCTLVGVEITVKQVDSVQWYGITTRKEFQLGINISGYGVDDPDAILFENYGCTSLRNYTGYCDEGVSRLIEQQSQELDQKKRLALVLAIQRKLEEDVAKPMLGWRNDYFAAWPYVKNLVPHYIIYNWARMQDVWLDR